MLSQTADIATRSQRWGERLLAVSCSQTWSYLLFSNRGEGTELDEKRTCSVCLCRCNCSTSALASEWDSIVLLDH